MYVPKSKQPVEENIERSGIKMSYLARPSVRISLVQSSFQRPFFSLQKLQLIADNLIVVVNEGKQIETYVSSISAATIFSHL